MRHFQGLFLSFGFLLLMEDEVPLFARSPCLEDVSNGHKLKHVNILLDMRNFIFFCEDGCKLEHCSTEKLWSLHPLRCCKAILTQTWTTSSRWPCLSHDMNQKA